MTENEQDSNAQFIAKAERYLAKVTEREAKIVELVKLATPGSSLAAIVEKYQAALEEFKAQNLTDLEINTGLGILQKRESSQERLKRFQEKFEGLKQGLSLGTPDKGPTGRQLMSDLQFPPGSEGDFKVFLSYGERKLQQLGIEVVPIQPKTARSANPNFDLTLDIQYYLSAAKSPIAP